jgi:hypothetical protein
MLHAIIPEFPFLLVVTSILLPHYQLASLITPSFLVTLLIVP